MTSTGRAGSLSSDWEMSLILLGVTLQQKAPMGEEAAAVLWQEAMGKNPDNGVIVNHLKEAGLREAKEVGWQRALADKLLSGKKTSMAARLRFLNCEARNLDETEKVLQSCLASVQKLQEVRDTFPTKGLSNGQE